MQAVYADYSITSDVDSATTPNTLTDAFALHQADNPFVFDANALANSYGFLHTDSYTFSQDITFEFSQTAPQDFFLTVSAYGDSNLGLFFFQTSQSIDIGNNAFTIDKNAAFFFGGVMKGNGEGALNIIGSSNIRFAADFTAFSSPITLGDESALGGVVVFNTGITLGGNLPSSPISFNNISSQLAFLTESGSNAIYSGTISGMGVLIKQGSGMLTLGATNSFYGTIEIQGGTLILENNFGTEGQLDASLTIDAGALLIAQGNLYSHSISNFGAFQVPLGQVLTTDSDFDHLGILGVNVDVSIAGTAGELSVDGTFTFEEGSLIYVFPQNTYGAGGEYTFLSSSNNIGIQNTPAVVSDDPTLVFSMHTTDPKNFFLTAAPSSTYAITSTTDGGDNSLTGAFTSHQVATPFIFQEASLGANPSFSHTTPYTFIQNIEFQTEGYTSADTISISAGDSSQEMDMGIYGLIFNSSGNVNFTIGGTLTSDQNPPPGFFFLRQKDSGIITFDESADLSEVYSNIQLSGDGTLIFNTSLLPQGTLDTGASGSIVFDFDDTAAYGSGQSDQKGGLIGEGNIIKRGQGSFSTTTSYNPFTGTISIEEGLVELAVFTFGQAGFSGGDITIGQKGIVLAENGTIFSSNIINQGIFVPFYLTVERDVSNQAGSYFFVFADITASTSAINSSFIPLTSTGGAITFDEGSILVVTNQFFKEPSAYTTSMQGQQNILFLQALNINGVPTVITDIPFYNFSYFVEGTPGDSMQAYLGVQPSIQKTLNAGATRNERSVAQYLDELDLTVGTGLEGFGLFNALGNNALAEGEPATLADLYAALILGSNPTQVNAALNQMHTGIYKGLSFSQENNMKVILQSLADRLNEVYLTQCAPSLPAKKKRKWGKKQEKEERVSVWGEWVGDFLTQEGVYGNPGFHTLTNGFLIGVDASMPFYKPMTVGGSFGYTHSNVIGSGHQAEVGIDSIYLGGYEKCRVGGFFVDTALLAGWSKYAGYRNISIFLDELDASIVNFQTRATTSHHGWEIDGLLKTGYDFHLSQTHVMPYFWADYLYLKEAGFHEDGANYLNLDVKKTAYQRMRLESGLFASFCVCRSSYCFIPEIKFSGIYERRIGGKWYTESFVDQPGDMRIEGISPGQLWLLSPGAAFTFSLANKHLDLTLRYNGEFSANTAFGDNTAHFEILYKF